MTWKKWLGSMVAILVITVLWILYGIYKAKVVRCDCGQETLQQFKGIQAPPKVLELGLRVHGR